MRRGIKLTDKSIDRIREELDRAKESGRNNEKIAEEIGVEPETLSAWKNGSKNPALSKIEKLAGALHVRASYLLGEDPYRTRAEERAAELLRFANRGTLEASVLYRFLALRGYTFEGSEGPAGQEIDEDRVAAQVGEILAEKYGEALQGARIEAEGVFYRFASPEGEKIRISSEDFGRAEDLVADLALATFRNLSE